MRKYLFSILLLFFLISCSKSEKQAQSYTVSALALDWDSRTPLPDAKVYLAEQFIIFNSPWKIFDSATTDINGRAFFVRSEAEYSQVFGISKPGYVRVNGPAFPITQRNQDRTDTCYLGMPSFVNLTIHNSHSYLPGDSVVVSAKDYYSLGQPVSFFDGVFSGPAVSPDRTVQLTGFYLTPNSTKIWIQCKVYRNNTEIYYTGLGYAEMIQFGTVNYTMNY
ncbi:MAG: hypothetical protein HZB42_01260 [Sphingobacteriales bacterium]|nr:hypothetical protein [Sphingobacteriales bacterium]